MLEVINKLIELQHIRELRMITEKEFIEAVLKLFKK